MAKFGDRGPAGDNGEPVGRPDVQYVLVATLIGAILLLILLSIIVTM